MLGFETKFGLETQNVVQVVEGEKPAYFVKKMSGLEMESVNSAHFMK